MWFCCSAIGDEDRSSIVGYGPRGRGIVAQETVFGARLAEVCAQGLAFAFAAEEAGALHGTPDNPAIPPSPGTVQRSAKGFKIWDRRLSKLQDAG